MSRHWGNPLPLCCVPHQVRSCPICAAKTKKGIMRFKQWRIAQHPEQFEGDGPAFIPEWSLPFLPFWFQALHCAGGGVLSFDRLDEARQWVADRTAEPKVTYHAATFPPKYKVAPAQISHGSYIPSANAVPPPKPDWTKRRKYSRCRSASANKTTMITESFRFHGRISNGRESSTSRRSVIITGKKDLNAFADVVGRQAEDARNAGQVINADRLDRLAAKIRRSKRFEIVVPMDAKLGSSGEK